MTRLYAVSKLILGLILLGVIAAGSMRISAGPTPKKIRLIYTDDMMGNVKPCG